MLVLRRFRTGKSIDIPFCRTFLSPSKWFVNCENRNQVSWSVKWIVFQLDWKFDSLQANFLSLFFFFKLWHCHCTRWLVIVCQREQETSFMLVQKVKQFKCNVLNVFSVGFTLLRYGNRFIPVTQSCNLQLWRDVKSVRKIIRVTPPSSLVCWLDVHQLQRCGTPLWTRHFHRGVGVEDVGESKVVYLFSMKWKVGVNWYSDGTLDLADAHHYP